MIGSTLIVGLRWVQDLSEKSKVSIRGDVGGFGVGSQHTLNGSIYYDYNPWKTSGSNVVSRP